MTKDKEIRILKERIRNEVWARMGPTSHGAIPTFPGQNRAAERLRHLPCYQETKAIMVPPDLAQLQVRINAIVDGKRLIMATPGMRDGFYLLEKNSLRARDWAIAPRSTNVRRFGRRLATSLAEIGKIDLMVTGAVAVDLRGGRLGKGSGFFDLEYLLLKEIGAVGEETRICAIVDDAQIYEEVPMETRDVAIDIICTPTRVIYITDRSPRPEGIPWDEIGERGIKKMRPLRELKGSR